MITNFKIFEKLDTDIPKLHDYVICYNQYYSIDVNNYLMSKIGKIYQISYSDGKPLYSVIFDELIKLPNHKYEQDSLVFWKNEIKHWSNNKKDLEQFVEIYDDITKYNL